MKKAKNDSNLNKKSNILTDQTVDSSNASLKKVARGMGILFIGIIVSMVLSFLTKIILARYFTQTDYGIYSLGFSIINVVLVISVLGLNVGSTRQIAYYRGKKNFPHVQGIISASIHICIISSLILSMILILTSDFLSVTVFHNIALSFPLKIFAISIPFITITNVLISIYRGFDRMEEKVLFEDFFQNILFFILLLPVIFFSFSFHYAIITFTVSYIVTLIVFVIYTKKRQTWSLIRTKGIHHITPIYKDLLLFSMPLLSIALFQMILSWTDSLMLGGMKTLDEVGLYNAAAPISSFVGIGMGALLLIYAPIITVLFSKDALPEMRRTYTILTKWIFLTSLPLFFIIFLYPQVFLNSLFGSEYVSASLSLQVLALGVLIINLLGPNGTTLVAIGKTRFLMWTSIVAAVMNIILNAVLIPPLGILGASIATSIAVLFYCVIRQMKVHSLLQIKLMTRNLLKPTIISVPLILLIWYLVRNVLVVTIWMLPLFFALFTIIILLAILFTRSLDQEDIMMVEEIEKKIGINLAPIKKLLCKFL